jgi:hypothetical protein
VAARIASTLLVVGLLVATAVAFAVTERLKLVRSPIAAPRIDRVVGPLCDCPRGEAAIVFQLRDADRVTVSIVDSGDRRVRTLLEEAVPAGDLELAWDGRDDGGEVVPEGRYRPRVHLARERRTITLPNPIRVDTTPPSIRVVDVRPRVISPGVGETNNRIDVLYEVDEPARGILLVDGERHVYTYRRPLEGRMQWFGRFDEARLPAGTYQLHVQAEDVAGNLSERVDAGTVEVRYVALSPTSVRVAPGNRFGVDVETDADRVEWRFARAGGTAEPGRLVLRAPQRPGTYTLFVEATGRAARVEVLVVDR